ncbi:hypothetical protein [Pseudoxanthomonas winnipegensis]|uniref:Uncharacterized protein n=1 Tax=Pseudoxanthomonas winnipegensis TaxID=2480810 RepID=A0A4Q8M3I9_9GAMM|nr:hypothetical protein [Pseudoxanthomonas winnipegensis]TAA41562.1 hypothetical protein EA655_11510 [Pseudoxanthomonas winnipegensis]
MKRKTYFQWVNVSGKCSWHTKGVHEYLMEKSIHRDYMRMKEFTGKRKIMTCAEKLEMEGT